MKDAPDQTISCVAFSMFFFNLCTVRWFSEEFSIERSRNLEEADSSWVAEFHDSPQTMRQPTTPIHRSHVTQERLKSAWHTRQWCHIQTRFSDATLKPNCIPIFISTLGSVSNRSPCTYDSFDPLWKWDLMNPRLISSSKRHLLTYQPLVL